jgi:hypothetical protein
MVMVFTASRRRARRSLPWKPLAWCSRRWHLEQRVAPDPSRTAARVPPLVPSAGAKQNSVKSEPRHCCYHSAIPMLRNSYLLPNELSRSLLGSILIYPWWAGVQQQGPWSAHPAWLARRASPDLGQQQLQLARQPRRPHLSDGDIEGAVSATVDVRYTLSSSTSSSKFSAK